MSVPILVAPWEFMIPGYSGAPNVKLTASSVSGGLQFMVSVDTTSGRIADLRGLFFNLLGDAPGTLTVTGGDVTASATNTIDLGNGANMQGGVRKAYDVGVEFGTAGIGKDDIQTTTFVVNGLSLDDVYGQEFGVRLTSVGALRGKRDSSAKLSATAPGKIATLQDGLELGPASFDDTLPLSPVSQEITGGDKSSVTYRISIAVPDLPEVADIVLMQDLTGSFADDLPNVRANFDGPSGLYSALNADGRDVDFGVASFVDKPSYPFGDGTSGDYAYVTNQAISGNQSITQGTLNGLTTFNGVDGAESQLEALLQLANRSSELNWRDQAQRFVVVSTDAPYHQAGDAALAGYSWPANDGDGVIDEEDYPLLGQVKDALNAANIEPIFAVTSGLIPTYESLVAELGRGAVVELSSDSSNLTDAVLNGLREVTVDVKASVLSDDYGLVQAIAPVGGYDEVDGPETVTFDVTLAPSASYGSDQILIDFGAFGVHSIDVQLATTTLEGSVGADVLNGNNGANVLIGHAASDVLSGNGGQDDLHGNSGQDRLIGGFGNDMLSGGPGRDTFVLAKDDGDDTITDFETTAAGDPINDVIEFAASTGLSSYTAVVAATTVNGADLEIAYTGGVVTLSNMALSHIGAANFTFV